jgi:PAS domain-containing protein
MARTGQKHITLILARELAAHVASPFFLVDHEGRLVYYNERAESILGVRFDEAGEMKADEWGSKWLPEDLERGRLPLEELPLAVAMLQKRPAHRPLRITGLDGVQRVIEVTAFPLFSKEDEFVGAVAIFWEREG